MNKLANETSPYLLQHAHNPVNWYPWGEEALEKAKKENKPILVSIGYSACHWCHVMERESFEDEETAAFMNSRFINIKIDREERPDLDQIYMDAVQAITGSGGWPLNVFLLPDARPFYGGTYFPPRRAFNRGSWMDVLQAVSRSFNERRTEMEEQAANLTSHLFRANSFGISDGSMEGTLFSRAIADEAFENLMRTADTQWGGFGQAPKFPQTFSIKFLFRYYRVTGNQEALKQALLSLDKMIYGGIYDQLGGGFARYSTDTEWLAPHFEKMLYDNALLVITCTEAFAITGSKEYERVVRETLSFVERELMHPDAGFYAALDADSEGEEGLFYVWSRKEVDEILGDDSIIFSEYYDISETGNWEGKNILRVRKPLAQMAAEKGMEEEMLRETINRSAHKLFSAREKRVRPGLDDKVILSWNALMNVAYSKAAVVFQDENWMNIAMKNMNFLLSQFKSEKSWKHTWKNGSARLPAFLDDLAALCHALSSLYSVSFDVKWLEEARELTDHIVDEYSEEGSSYFYYTGRQQEDVILRKREIFDGALPSGNSMMAYNLLHFGIIFHRPEWKERAAAMFAGLGRTISKHPGSFGNWACLMLELISGTEELAVLGNDYKEAVKEIQAHFHPHLLIMAAAEPQPGYPLFEGREGDGSLRLFLCRNYTCRAPFYNMKDFLRHLSAESHRFAS